MVSERCSVCPHKYRMVPGDGPTPCDFLFVGEAPGRDEDSGGRPFIGQAGLEFNENYLRLAGLERDEIYITNTVKCRPDLNRKPGAKEVKGCSEHWLPEELERVQPKVVFLMGATACSLIEGIDLEVEHGIPRWGRLFGWEGWVCPMYHPAAGLHDGTMMIPLLEDFERVGLWLANNGAVMWPVEHTKPPVERDYRLIQDVHQVTAYFHQHSTDMELIGVDTESHDGVPWSIQVSIKPGTARLVRMDNEDGLWGLKRQLLWAIDEGVELVFHQAGADLGIVGGLVEREFKYRDTMQECYQFGNFLRQGLKVLAYRLLGRRRKSWEETVTPYSKAVLGQWMMDGFVHAEQNWQRVETTIETNRVSEKTGKALKDLAKTKLIRSPAEVLTREILGYTLNNPEYETWEKLEERVPVEWMSKLVEVAGPVPQLGIAHCPLDVAVEYGCSDADDTLQLALLFDRMRLEFQEGLDIQPEDCDVVNINVSKAKVKYTA